MDLLVFLVIVIFSAAVHEVCHGLMAGYFGDDTAKEQGRITLNPLNHIDPIGSLLLPLLLWFSQRGAAHPIIFGYARPVPVNFNNLHPKKLGTIMVALAGPASNLALAIIFALILKLGFFINYVSAYVLLYAIIINLFLFIFNLIPIPPLDGSKILASFLPEEWEAVLFRYEQFGFILVFIFLSSGLLNNIADPIINFFGKLFGIGL